jgi:hypothetical protein
LIPAWLAAGTISAAVNPGVPWPATDALGRELPLAAEVGPPKKDRFVGIYYLGWTGDEYSYGPYDVTKILAEHPDAPNAPNFPHRGPKTWHMVYWGEPLFGYYKQTDSWVIRRHMKLLSDAGVDALALDASNGEIYEDIYRKLFTVMEEIHKEGGHPPKFFFFASRVVGKTSMELLEKFYKPGCFRDLWFMWDGKPLLMGMAAPDPEVKEFFTIREAAWPGKPPYKNTPYAWHWENVYPQTYGFTEDPKVAEQMNVSPAQNMHWQTGALEMMQTGEARGRGFHESRKDSSLGAVQRGLNFQEQWDRVLKVDPKFVMITSWNEWLAGLGDSFQLHYSLCDMFNEEFSRDIEPLKGGFGDNYYYQAIANIRRYKGAPEIPVATAPKTIDIAGSFDQWNDIGPEFLGHTGNTIHRDHDGWGRASKTRITPSTPAFKGDGKIWRGQDGLRYINKTGRNSLLSMKVARDKDYFYFYVRTEKPITPQTDPNWMTLLIRTGNPTHHTWSGYDYVVNRVAPGKDGALLEKNNGGQNWLKAADIRFRMQGNQMHLAVPRTLLKLNDDPVQFDFKWLDNIALPLADDLSVFYTDGDTAPIGRFRFRYATPQFVSEK